MIQRPGRLAMSLVESIGADPSDDEDTRLKKRLLVAISLMVIQAAILWCVIYVAFGEPLAGTIPLSYAAVSLASVGVFAVNKRFGTFRFSQLLLILLLPFLLMLELGGFVQGSAVILWALLAPLGAMLFADRRSAVGWSLAFLALVGLSGGLEPFRDVENDLPSTLVIAFFAMNVGTVSAIAFVLVLYVLSLLDQERQKSERLLINVLPKEVAAILRDGEQTIADQFEAVSVLFADVVGSTQLATRLTARELVDLLNEAFSYFDSLTEKHGLEKIRTIGDNYMVAAGVPKPREDHAQVLARMALEMQEFNASRPIDAPHLEFRMGINSGPVVGGVIGHTKFHYDIWGDAVNTASRMESHGIPGKIQITTGTRELLGDGFVCTPRGPIDVKGKGVMETWWLEGIKASGEPSADGVEPDTSAQPAARMTS